MIKKEYTKGLIAFLDILGFKNYIKNRKSCEEVIEIYNFIESISYLYNSSNIGGIKIAFFSDSFVLSTEEISRQSLYNLCAACYMINIKLYDYAKLFTRGAICMGDFYQNDNIAFGPGVIKAYEEQEEKAKYVRMIVSNDVYKILKEDSVGGIGLQIQKDENDVMYYNYYIFEIFDIMARNKTTEITEDNLKEFFECMDKNKKIILENLENYKDKTEIYEKYKWLIIPYNYCCEFLNNVYKTNLDFIDDKI